MNEPAEREALTASRAPHEHRGGHHGGHHGWMMLACCIPMLAIAVALWAAGVVSAGFILLAVACTAMMALMMGGMHGTGSRSADDR